MFTIVFMSGLGFPFAMLAKTAERHSDGRVTFREPRARKGRLAPKGAIILRGDHRAAVHDAVWEPTDDFGSTRSRHTGFSPAWDDVMSLFASDESVVTS